MLLNRKYEKFVSKHSSKELSRELGKLQRQVLASDHNISIIIQIEGWESSGRGPVMLEIMREVDQRYIHAYVEESVPGRWPFLYDLWEGLPAYGQAAIYARSCYTPLFASLGLDEEFMDAHVQSYQDTVQTLYADNVIMIKLFLDVSEVVQKERIQSFAQDPYRKFYISQTDIEENRRYKAMREHFSKVLSKTNFKESPWHIINADDLNRAAREALTIINREIRSGIARIEKQEQDIAAGKHIPYVAPQRTYQEKDFVLDKISPNVDLTKEEYAAKLEPLQQAAADMQLRLKAKGIPTVIVFEGMDAGGKGGSIKRLTRLMDPRFFFVATTAAPSSHELAHNYLWRFYKYFPEFGNMTIFDRSWYGRVLVERIEAFASPHEWERAYDEINKMERELTLENTLILKYYLHIDKDEQEKRFKQRMADQEKHYKITEEDWRNRDKWDRYWEATNEMLVRSSTAYAPWKVIPGNNKRAARIMILEDYLARAEAAVKKSPIWYSYNPF